MTIRVSPLPKTTPCIGCGRKRFSGWVLKRCGFRLPMCSRCVMNLVKINPLKPIPNPLRVRFHQVRWTVDKDAK